MTQAVTDWLPDGWREITLWEISKIKWGKRLPKWKTLTTNKTPHPYIRITDLTGSSVNKSNLQFVEEETQSKISRYIVNEWDVILSIVWTIWYTALIDKDLDFANLTENCVKIIDLEWVQSKFVYYYLLSRVGQYEIMKNTVWAVQLKLPIYGVQNINILLPPPTEQQAISSVLSSFDDKIELLREQIEILEKIAQTLFKKWFGKYNVDRPEELPEGWRVGKIADFWEIVCGKTPSKSEARYFLWDVPFIKIPDMHGNMFLISTEDSLTQEWANTQSKKELPAWSIIVSCIATVWLVWITTKPSHTNQQINWIVLNDEKSTEYLYLYLRSIYKKLLAIWSWWSATLNINTKIFSNIEVIIPHNDALNKFSEIAWGCFDKIKDNNIQIQSLSKTRDALLPKLMSGKMRVKF